MITAYYSWGGDRLPLDRNLIRERAGVRDTKPGRNDQEHQGASPEACGYISERYCGNEIKWYHPTDRTGHTQALGSRVRDIRTFGLTTTLIWT